MVDVNFVYVWKYTILPEYRREFLAAYGSKGDWEILFSRDAKYLKTELLQDSADENVYMTIDYWTSKEARDTFRNIFADEFNALDQKCESYTVSETFIGDFTTHNPIVS